MAGLRQNMQLGYLNMFMLFSAILLLLGVSVNASDAPKRVAIVGAGAGGSSASYYLEKFTSSADVDVEMTVYEKNDFIGGRCTTVNVYDDPEYPVELGASIFVAVNEILVNATRDLELDLKETTIDSYRENIGIFDGDSFLFTVEESKLPWWGAVKMLWKYGLAPVRTQNLMHTAIGKFLRMYQPPYFPFSDLTVTAADVGLLETTGVTGQQLLAKNGLDGHFAEEIIQASTRVNYASNLGLIHGLETLVCMAATEGLQIAGGNWQIFKKMLDSSKAKVHKSTVVSKLEKTPKGTWRVYSSPADANGGSHVRVTEFDAVILATPYQYAEIEISPAPVKVPDTIPYASLHVTLFTSPNKLSPKYFGMLEGQGVPGVILTTLNATEQKNEAIKRGEGIHGVGNVGFYSISTLREIKKAGQPVEYLYKVFSPDDFTNERINKIIGVEGAGSEKITWTHRKIWNSYPHEYPRVTFENIILDGDDESLFYTSAIESFISTMETNSLMGMNVAKLLSNKWAKTGGAGHEHGSPQGKEQVVINKEL